MLSHDMDSSETQMGQMPLEMERKEAGEAHHLSLKVETCEVASLPQSCPLH